MAGETMACPPWNRSSSFNQNGESPPMNKTLTSAEIAEHEQLTIELSHLIRDSYMPTNEELDHRFDDCISDSHSWFRSFLKVLGAWIEISDLALESRNPNTLDFQHGPNPSFSPRRQELSGLLEAVMVAYEPAHKESSPYSADWATRCEATRELMKRYRLYTKCVQEFAREVWPGIEL
jgi:hypothetical protein